MRILSLAPHFRLSSSAAGYSHYIPFQMDLRAAAAGIGHDLAIVTRVGAAGADPSAVGALDVLPRWPKGQKFSFDWEPAAQALEALLVSETERLHRSEPLVVLRYEGRLQEFPRLAELAHRNPRVRFIWNLFALYGDAVPGMPPGSRPSVLSRDRWRRAEPVRSTAAATRDVVQPDNLIVVGDAWSRHSFALAMGIRSSGVWPLASSIPRLEGGTTPDVPRVDPPVVPPRAHPSRVLILQAGWQFDTEIRGVVLRAVKEQRVRHEDARPDFTVSGHQGNDRVHLRWLSRMERLGVTVHREAAPWDEYVRRLLEHDAVWLPNGQLYREKSSGKVLDALTLGVPVLSPAGSFQATQLRRWVPWGLDYTGGPELQRILGNLDFFLPSVRDELQRRLVEVQTDTAPVTAIDRLLRLARSAK